MPYFRFEIELARQRKALARLEFRRNSLLMWAVLRVAYVMDEYIIVEAMR
ncbi:MAG: hypothetical protein ABI835_02810 [Chloroflexota bacterium]